MFERRLKTFLTVIFVMAGIVTFRATQLQIFQRSRWQAKADEAMRHWSLVDTPRGKIYDRTGLCIAYDDACIDAAVDYRAISLDPEWIKAQARKRLPSGNEVNLSGLSRGQLLTEEIERVKSDIDAMWVLLAKTSGKTTEDIEVTRQEIMRRVLLLRRNAWYKRFAKAGGREEQTPSPWYQRWLVDARSDDPDQQHDAALDASFVTVGEQLQAHVILPDIDNAMQVELRKKMPQCPGLELRESTHRKYDPTAAIVVCHVLGRLVPVDEKEVQSPINANLDPLKKYLPRDLIGRAGLEGLAEPTLRGTKGQLIRHLGNKIPEEAVKPSAGGDATTSLDVSLQADILESFKTVKTFNARLQKDEVFHELHGAAVVLDVKTNEVLVMASYPTFNMNTYEADYNKLRLDDINGPLLNRATLAHEPGSTVKTIIGAVAITEGVIHHDTPIECTGYLIVPDRRTGQPIRLRGTNRCWVASQFEGLLGVGGVAHHPVPIPHHSMYGFPDGFLVVPEALERSCNVFFETVADRMHLEGVTAALREFGLGQRTGVGIPESAGRVPHVHPLAPDAKYETDADRHAAWLAGIGQGQVAATPLQMANVAATFARRGVWMRPRLLTGPAAALVYKHSKDDTKDLNLAPLALDAVKMGMINVVSGAAGTGPQTKRKDIQVAAKTGSAQTVKFSIPLRGPDGQELHEPDASGVDGSKGALIRKYFEPGSTTRPSELPWYYEGVGVSGEHLAHAWYIGYAPADNPKIAFCVFVEYGGNGGQVSGSIARDLIQACIAHGYLSISHDPG